MAEVPDAWIAQENVLYVVPKEYETTLEKAERANTALARLGCNIRLTAQDFWPSRVDELYVDPVYITEQQWPSSAHTRDRATGWVRVLRFDLDGLAPDSRA